MRPFLRIYALSTYMHVNGAYLHSKRRPSAPSLCLACNNDMHALLFFYRSKSSPVHFFLRKSSSVHIFLRESSSVHFCLRKSSSVHFCLWESSSVHFFLRKSSSIHFCLWESSSVHFFLQKFSPAYFLLQKSRPVCPVLYVQSFLSREHQPPNESDPMRRCSQQGS